MGHSVNSFTHCVVLTTHTSAECVQLNGSGSIEGINLVNSDIVDDVVD